jgi:hypothetical protein
MKVTTLRDFRDRATSLLRSKEPVLITRDGMPAGFFVPWGEPELPDDTRRGIYLELARRARVELRRKHLTERRLIADFRAARRARR